MEPARELLIDEQAATLALGAQDLAAWGARQRVFVSSLITDMPAERDAARRAIESFGATPVMFEDLGGQDVSAEDAFLAGVRTSNIYVGLLGPRYGVRMSNGYSATEAEFREAEREGLRLAVFVHGTDTANMDGAQRDLLAGMRNLLTTSDWSSPEDLERRVSRRLTELAAEELAPWVRLGTMAFRATQIAGNGQTLSIWADIRSRAVYNELIELRDGRGSDIPFASPDEARTVQVSGLTSTVRSTVGKQVEIGLAIRERRDGGLSMGSLSSNGKTYTSADLARLALFDALFGTRELPEFGGHSAVDPLAALRGRGLIDAVVRPVARLLIGEHLLGRGDAATIDDFWLGPSHGGTRRLRVAWTPPRLYQNGPKPERLTVEGDISDL